MIVSPSREKFIKENFFEFSFDDKEPNFEKFQSLNSFEQFFLAEIYNWDDGTEVLNWIIDSKNCDKGTASMIFWRSAPDYYFGGENELAEYEQDIFKLLKSIIDKFKNKKFKSSKIKYNPNEDFEIEESGEKIKDWKLPTELTKPTKGLKPIYLGTFIKFLKNKYKKSRRKKRSRN